MIFLSRQNDNIGNCEIYVSRNVGKPSPIMLYPGTKNSVRASNSAGRLSLNNGNGILLACPGQGNYVRINRKQESIAYCVGGTTFSLDGTHYDFNQLACQKVYKLINFMY